MAWGDYSKYFVDETTLEGFCPEPLTGMTVTKLQNTIQIAEAEVNKYLISLGFNGANLPLTGTDITTEFKMGVAMWCASVAYRQHQQLELANRCLNGYANELGYIEGAKDMIQRFAENYDLSITTPITRPITVNYQKEYIADWREPNDVAEAMDE